MTTKTITLESIADDLKTLAGGSSRLARRKVRQMIHPSGDTARHAFRSIRGAADKSRELAREEFERGVRHVRKHPVSASAIGLGVLACAFVGSMMFRRHN